MVHFVEDGGEQDSLAPVTPLFRERDSEASVSKVREPRDRPAQRNGSGVLSTSRGQDSRRSTMAEPDDARANAENALLRKLRARSLSLREARTVLAAHISDGNAQEELIESFIQRGYLNDSALAEQLIYSGMERKGQGRRAIAQTLMQRGIARDVSDAALAALPDDDDDRALEFARSKARSLRSVDRQAALRRLTGQLGRRGFPGSVALGAARQALEELD